MMHYSNLTGRLMPAALAIMAVFAAISCNKTVDENPDLQISISGVNADETSVEFSIEAKNAEYYTYSLTLQGETLQENRVEGSESGTYSFSELQPDTEYTVKASAFHGDISKEAAESFRTGKATPAVQIQNVVAEANSVSFDIVSENATRIFWLIYEGTEEPADAEWTESEPEAVLKCSSDGLKAMTQYTVTAYALNGDIESEKGYAQFTTQEDPLSNGHISVRCAAASQNILVEVRCSEMDGKNYYCNIFSPDASVYDYDSGENYFVNTKENFLKYVTSEKNYLSWATLYGNTDKYMWTEYDFDYNSLSPGKEYMVYAVTFTENGEEFTFDQDGIIEVRVRTTEKDMIGDGTASLQFTVTPQSDKAEITFTNTDDVVGCAYGYVKKADAEAAGGIEEYVSEKFSSSNLHFYAIDSYFESTRQERNLSPDTEYYYYTLSYGKDARLGSVVAKEFRTTDVAFSEDYKCVIELASMSGSEAKFTISYTGCYQGRGCNITSEEFTQTYGGDVNKAAKALLLSSSAEQVFEKAYAYSLENGKDYVFVVLPMGGDMSNIYGTPAKLEYTFSNQQ